MQLNITLCVYVFVHACARICTFAGEHSYSTIPGSGYGRDPQPR